MWLEEVLDSVSKLGWLLSLSVFCGTLLLIVRLLYKAVFDKETGEIKLLSKKDNTVQLAKQELVNKEQEVKNKEMAQAFKSIQHERCPMHDGLMQMQIDVKSQQQLNILRLGRLEHDMEDTQRMREEMNKKLTQICINTGAIITEQKSMSEDIKELKERRISERG